MRRFPRVLKSIGKNESFLDESRILVTFKEPTDINEVRSIAKDLKMRVETGESETGKRDEPTKHWGKINNTPLRYWLRFLDGSPIGEEKFAQIEEKLGNKVEWIGPVYKNINENSQQAYFSPLPTVLLLRKTGQDKMLQSLNEYGLKINEFKSKYLSAYYYLEVEDVKNANAYEIRERLLEEQAGEVLFENMPMYKPLATTTPNDTYWANQWNMAQINAPDGWDISTGSNTVVICILDEGCDLTHPDLQFVPGGGINLGTMMPTGAPTGNHGTACAGIAAGTFNNSGGVAGVAGDCLIMPVAWQNSTDVECASGINYAAANGAAVISMSFGVYDGWGWDYAVIDPEIQNAFTNNVIMCAATGNENDGTTNRYPGRHPLVIAVGGSSTDDNRKTPASPDGECWGANFGEDVYDGITTGVSVVAPCVQCPTTDRQGADGYNNNGTLIPNPWACVTYPAPPADGNYIMNFDGTSAATPHVAGLAALLKSKYPALTNVQIRNIIERTAAKAGTTAYAEMPGFPNGTRNQEMGYGRIDVFHALDFADVLIKDWPGDDGTEPSNEPSGDFWDFSDIVVRPADDNVFNPTDVAGSKNVERGQTNYIYVRVTNNGPRDATNVAVNIRITPYVGLQFVYPADWTAIDATHVSPTPINATFPTIVAGGTETAKFSISAAQTDDLYGWVSSHPWHPCLLAQVTADNDYAYATSDLSFGNIVVRKNNFAQRNLSVIDIVASVGASASMAFPFVAGSKFSKANFIKLNIDKSQLPANTKVTLNLKNNEKMFPGVDFKETQNQNTGCAGILFALLKMLFGIKSAGLKVGNVKGGKLTTKNGAPAVEIAEGKSIIELDSAAGSIYALSVDINFPNDVKKGELYTLKVFQTNEFNVVIGGATAIYRAK